MKHRFLLLLCCFVLDVTPLRAQADCPLPVSLQAGAGGRIRFTDGRPLRMLDDPGDGAVITTLFEGQNVTILDDPPRCLQGVRWWKVGWWGQTSRLDGWIPERVGGVDRIEPLTAEIAQKNTEFQRGLLYTHLWSVFVQDTAGISIAFMNANNFRPITQATHGVVLLDWNQLFVWDETGLYSISSLGELKLLVEGDQSRIVDVAEFNNSIAVLYAEDCQNCYSIVTLDLSEEMTVVVPLWRGQTEHPLTGLETWTLMDDPPVIFVRQETERANSPYPSSGAILAISAEHGAKPLETVPKADEAISDHGRWLASVDDHLRLTNLDTNEHYTLNLEYGDIGAMPVFSGENHYLSWLEIDLKDNVPQTVTLRAMELTTRKPYTLYTFDVRDGRLPMPDILTDFVILTVYYHDNILAFDIREANLFTTWLPAPARRIIGTLGVGD